MQRRGGGGRGRGKQAKKGSGQQDLVARAERSVSRMRRMKMPKENVCFYDCILSNERENERTKERALLALLYSLSFLGKVDGWGMEEIVRRVDTSSYAAWSSSLTCFWQCKDIYIYSSYNVLLHIIVPQARGPTFWGRTFFLVCLFFCSLEARWF